MFHELNVNEFDGNVIVLHVRDPIAPNTFAGLEISSHESYVIKEQIAVHFTISKRLISIKAELGK